jgi:hypothetical protein
MLGAFAQENPLVAAIAGTVVVALVLLLAGAAITHLFDRRRTSSAQETFIDEGYAADWSRADDSGGPSAVATPQAVVSPRARRSGFGFGVVMVAFLVGLVLGGAGIAVSSRSVATAVASLVEFVGPMPPAPNGQASRSGAVVDSPGTALPPQPAPSSTVPTASPAEVQAELATFAERLKASLPRAAGPELSLMRVDLDGMRLSLGYGVARVMAEDEKKAFDAYIMRTVKSLFCGRDSREIRFLSENGAVFDMEYVGPDGQIVTKLTVEPGFCA